LDSRWALLKGYRKATGKCSKNIGEPPRNFNRVAKNVVIYNLSLWSTAILFTVIKSPRSSGKFLIPPEAPLLTLSYLTTSLLACLKLVRQFFIQEALSCGPYRNRKAWMDHVKQEDCCGLAKGGTCPRARILPVLSPPANLPPLSFCLFVFPPTNFCEAQTQRNSHSFLKGCINYIFCIRKSG
jgi:hypothetical protein